MSPISSNDSVVDEIRRIRHQISEEHGHDPKRLVAYYIEFQKQFKDRLIDSQKKSKEIDPTAA